MMVCLSGGVVAPVPLLSYLQASICRCEPLRDHVAVCSRAHTNTHTNARAHAERKKLLCLLLQCTVAAVDDTLQEISVLATHEMTTCCVFLLAQKPPGCAQN